MSQENVDLVHSAYAAYNEGDWEGARDVYDPEVIWDLSTYEGWPDTTEICGADALIDWLRGWASIYSDYYSKIDQIFDSGDQVVVLARLGGRERDSTEFAEMVWARSPPSATARSSVCRTTRTVARPSKPPASRSKRCRRRGHDDLSVVTCD